MPAAEMCHQVDFLSLKFWMRDMNFEIEYVEHLQLGGISFILFQRPPAWEDFLAPDVVNLQIVQ